MNILRRHFGRPNTMGTTFDTPTSRCLRFLLIVLVVTLVVIFLLDTLNVPNIFFLREQVARRPAADPTNDVANY